MKPEKINLVELNAQELRDISGGGVIYSIFYGIGYAAGEIVDGIDAVVIWFGDAVHVDSK